MSWFSKAVSRIVKTTKAVSIPVGAVVPFTDIPVGTVVPLLPTLSESPVLSSVLPVTSTIDLPITSEQSASYATEAAINKENSVTTEEYNYWSDQEQAFNNLAAELGKQNQNTKYILIGGAILLALLVLRK